MPQSVSVPEKTLEHWSSQYVRIEVQQPDSTLPTAANR